MANAIIDIGSNTINLLIAEINNAKLSILEDRKIHAKLARGGINNNTIAIDAWQRGMDALSNHLQLCKQYKILAEDIITYATASVRAASNGNEFAQEVKKLYGLSIQTIDGNTEATLIHEGIKNGFPLSDDKMLVMDIGGGSVEFVITNKDEIFWKKSIYLGVTKLLDKFNPSDPPGAEELENIRKHVSIELVEVFNNIALHKPLGIVGSSGSFDTIRAMLEAKAKANATKHTWYRINLNSMRDLAMELNKIPTAERMIVPGMDAMRAAYFPLAFVLIFTVLEHMSNATVYQCSYALKEGAFYYHFSQ